MIPMSFRTWRLWSFLLLTQACSFNDSSLYRVDPQPDPPPEISIRTNLDSIAYPLVIDSLGVSYQLEISNGEFYYMEAEVNGTPLYVSDIKVDSFLVPASVSLASGDDSLRMTFYYSSNTNSLADIYGLEARFRKIAYAIYFTGNQ